MRCFVAVDVTSLSPFIRLERTARLSFFAGVLVMALMSLVSYDFMSTIARDIPSHIALCYYHVVRFVELLLLSFSV